MSTTSNMGMSLPTVSSTLGPAWAQQINAALGVVDAHDHTSGKGVQIPSAGLSIDDDLSFGDSNATDLRSLRLSSQSAVLSLSTDLGCIYEVNGNLYWNNGSGTPVQITAGAQLAATSLGGISGLAGTSGSAAFAAGPGSFSWRQAANQAAVMDVGPLAIRDTAANALAVTFASPAGLAAPYTLTLPPALHAGTPAFLTVTAAGAMALAVDLDQGITRAMQASVGQQVSLSSAGFTTTSGTYTNVTNCSVSLTTTGRPVIVACVPADGSAGTFSADRNYDGPNQVSRCAVSARINVTGHATTTIGETTMAVQTDAPAPPGGIVTPTCFWPASSVWTLYAATAGTYTFTLQVKSNGTDTVAATAIKLVAYEL